MTYRYVWYAAIIVALAATLAGCGSSPVAVVDGVKITEQEFTDRLVSTFGRDMLRDMIDRELIRQAAEDAGIEITEEELNQEIEQAKAQFPSEEEFNQWLASRNLDDEQWRDHVRMILMTRKLALKDVQYTDADLKKFFEENKERFARPATVSLSEIVVSSREDAQEVITKLKEGASFSDLARQYSLAPATRETGGERPEIPLENIPFDSVRAAAKSLPVGQVSDPIEADGQWYVIKVRDRQAAREGSFEKDREIIKEQYEMAHARPLHDILKDQIAKSNVRIVDPRFQDLAEVYTAVPAQMPEFGAQSPAGAGAAPANEPAPTPAPAPAQGE